MRPFVLDIETDSTIQPDEDAEKMRRTEFVTAVGGFINQAAPLVQQFPQSGDFVSQTLKFVAAPFRAGRELEAAIDKFSDQIAQMAAQPPKTDPAQANAEIEAKARQDEMAMKQAEHQATLEGKKAELEFKREEMEFKRQEHQEQANDRQVDRAHKEKMAGIQLSGDKVKAGMPEGYSFDDDRMQFQAIMQEMSASRETQAQMMQLMMHQTQSIATGMQALAAAVTAPKQARKMPDGSWATETRMN
jgi:aminopeptidase N